MMKVIRHFLFVSFVYISLLSGCSPKMNTEKTIRVVIKNNLEKDIYVEQLSLALVDYNDEKTYYLSMMDTIDTNSFIPFAFLADFTNVIKSKEVYHVHIKEFEINNKRYEFPINEKGIVTEVLKEPEYEQVFFKLYYMMEPLEMRGYEEYVSVIKEKGGSALGYYENNEIIFVIDSEIPINNNDK